MNKTALVTGYTGQDGTFITKHLLEQGYKVLGMVRRISTEPPRRTRGKFDFTEYIDNGSLELVEGDLSSISSLIEIIRKNAPDEIYNLAAQSHVGLSFSQPENTIDPNFIGVVNLITALEYASPGGKDWKLYQASTSEMFGNTQAGASFNEDSRLEPRSPYAIAKAAAHQYCKMKREQGFFICCGILFNHESEIRGGDFVTQKIAREVARIEDQYQNLEEIRPMELGNLSSGRDWGYAGDYVKAMHSMLQQEEPMDYVIATGETHTVREFVTEAFTEIGKVVEWSGEGADEVGSINGEVIVKVNPKFYRPNDVTYLKGDASLAMHKLRWSPETDFASIVRIMVQEARS